MYSFSILLLFFSCESEFLHRRLCDCLTDNLSTVPVANACTTAPMLSSSNVSDSTNYTFVSPCCRMRSQRHVNRCVFIFCLDSFFWPVVHIGTRSVELLLVASYLVMYVMHTSILEVPCSFIDIAHRSCDFGFVCTSMGLTPTCALVFY